MLRWFEHHQVYHPSSRWKASGAELNRPWEDVIFTAADGIRLNGWFFTAPEDSTRGSWAVLLCHGNGGNISHRLEQYEILLQFGLNVFAFDYRGYGRSEGKPSEAGTYLDAQAGHGRLRERGFDSSRILVWGESLGGGVASELALREATAGIILHNSFTSIPDIGAELFPWLPVRWISHIQYDTKRKLPRITVPVMIFHSRDDRLIRFHHAEVNYTAANDPKMLWEINGGHNESPLVNAAHYREALEKFLPMIESHQAEGNQRNVAAKD